MLARVVLFCFTLMALPALSGCGLIFQLYAGYDREETHAEETTHTLLVNSLPRGARVEQIDGDRKIPLGTTPLEKKVTYQREVTIQRPASMKPFWFGAILDALLVAGSGVLLSKTIIPRIDNEDVRQLTWGVWSNLLIGVIAEAAVGGIVGGRPPTIIKRRDLPVELELAFSRPGGAEIQAHLLLPTAGERLTIPLDPLAARAMNRAGSPLTIIVAKTSSISILRPLPEARTSTRAR